MSDGDEQRGVMIDSPTTRDRDDAIWLRPHDAGVEIRVHVADVAAHLPLGSPGDLEARRRVHTRYLSDRVVGMLPKSVESASTLRADANQQTMVITVAFDPALEAHEVQVGRGHLVAPHQISYADVTQILDDTDHRLHTTLGHAQDLAHALLKRRRRQGALAFYDLYKGYATTEEGNVIRLADHQRHIGYLIVQEFMIAANAAVARWAARRDLPILYRNHRTSAVAGDITAILDDLVTAQSRGDTAGYELLRDRLSVVQRAAEYGPAVLGHHGLNLPTYTHATSPLRRYPDLVNQRMLLAAADGDVLPYTAAELAECAGEANERLQLERQRRAERHRAAAKRETRLRLEAPDYRDLNETDFGKVLRMALTGEKVPAGLVDETARRAQGGELSIRDCYELLLRARSDEWRPVRERVHHEVAAEPGNALTILNMYAQADTGATSGNGHLSWEIETVGTVQHPCFRAQLAIATAEGTVTSEPRTATSKKEAKAQAALALVGSLSGMGDLSTNTTASKPAVRQTPRVPADRNAMMAINEYAQTGTITTPSWEFERQGPSHEPVFTGTVGIILTMTGESLHAEAQAASKQGAKAEAAKELRSQIESRLDRLENSEADRSPDVLS